MNTTIKTLPLLVLAMSISLPSFAGGTMGGSTIEMCQSGAINCKSFEARKEPTASEKTKTKEPSKKLNMEKETTSKSK